MSAHHVVKSNKPHGHQQIRLDGTKQPQGRDLEGHRRDEQQRRHEHDDKSGSHRYRDPSKRGGA